MIKYLGQIADAVIVTLTYSFLLNTKATPKDIGINIVTAVGVAIIVDLLQNQIQKVDDMIGKNVTKDIVTLGLLFGSRIYLTKGQISKGDRMNILLAMAGATVYNVFIDRMIRFDIKPVYSTLLKMLLVFGSQDLDNKNPLSLDKIRKLSYRMNAVSASILLRSLINL
jgi:hypothetical protein